MPVELLRFPLGNGTTFTSDLWSAPGATVTIAATEVAGPDGPEPGFRSTVAYSGGGTFVAADYSPQRGQFVRVATHFGSETAFAEAILLSESSGATGEGFRATDLARFNGNAGDPASLAPRAMTVPDGAEELVLACFLPGDQGFYGAEVTTAAIPLACAGGAMGETKIASTFTGAMAGPGSVQAVAGGQGGINVEVFAIDTTPPA